MAAVATVTKKYGIGGTATVFVGTIALDSSYPTGGEVVSITGCERIEALIVTGPGYVFDWDQNDQKLLAYRDNGTATAAALPQVANAADLSAVTAAPFIAIGS